MVNELDVIAAFSAAGVEIVELEGMPFDRQAALFRAARVVIGAHGAGLANLVFATPPCRVVEVDVAGSARSFYSSLAAQIGLEYHRVSATATTPHALQHSDIRLTAADIGRILALAGSV